MPPLDRRRNRRRRIASWVLVGAAVAIVLALLIGGLADIGRASQPYQRSVNRSYGAGASVIAQRSNRTAAQLATLLPQLPNIDRQQLQARVNALVQATDTQATSADLLSPPEPSAGASGKFRAAMEDRARAMTDMASAIYTLLGMGQSTSAAGSAPTLQSVSSTEARLQAVGALLSRSDLAYATFRRTMHESVGHTKVPRSSWVLTAKEWSTHQVAVLTGALAGMPNLQVQHRIILVPNGIRLTPASVPPAAQPGGSSSVPPGASVVPPTHTVTVTAAVANQGNVVEHHVAVAATLRPLPSGTPTSTTTTVTIDPGASAVAAMPALRVRPGTEYRLTVSAAAPRGQTKRGGLSGTYAIWIAPG